MQGSFSPKEGWKMKITSLKDLPVEGKKVLLRVDFNVPQDDSLAITDDSRIRACLPSIRYLLKEGASIILMSHLGRPKGVTPKYSLAPCAQRLGELLHRQVTLAPDSIGPQVASMAQALHPGEILMLENLRFYEGEEHPEKDPSFAKSLAALGDLYVNDAFGTAHRAHASTAVIAQYFPGKKAAGFLLEKEICFLGEATQHPKRPFYALIGGAKVSSKLGVIKSLLEKTDGLFIGGGMAFTFLKAQGVQVGDSLVEEALLEEATAILKESHRLKKRLMLPVDVVITQEVVKDAPHRLIDLGKESIPPGWKGVDIGPQTLAAIEDAIEDAGTLLWNGPFGVFEIPPFDKGTEGIARLLANAQAVTLVGGGDSVAAVNALGLQESYTHLSTGGGASLEYLEFGTLPGLQALEDEDVALSPSSKGAFPL